MRNLLFLLLIMLVWSCEKEKGCTNIHSINYNPDAEIDNGDCRFAWDDFIGLYLVEDDCQIKGKNFYNVIISKTEDIERKRVFVENLYVPTTRFQGFIEGTNLVINDASIDAVGIKDISNNIVMDYYYFPTGDQCSCVWSKIE